MRLRRGTLCACPRGSVPAARCPVPSPCGCSTPRSSVRRVWPRRRASDPCPCDGCRPGTPRRSAGPGRHRRCGACGPVSQGLARCDWGRARGTLRAPGAGAGVSHRGTRHAAARGAGHLPRQGAPATKAVPAGSRRRRCRRARDRRRRSDEVVQQDDEFVGVECCGELADHVDRVGEEQPSVAQYPAPGSAPVHHRMRTGRASRIPWHRAVKRGRLPGLRPCQGCGISSLAHRHAAGHHPDPVPVLPMLVQRADAAVEPPGQGHAEQGGRRGMADDGVVDDRALEQVAQIVQRGRSGRRRVVVREHASEVPAAQPSRRHPQGEQLLAGLEGSRAERDGATRHGAKLRRSPPRGCREDGRCGRTSPGEGRRATIPGGSADHSAV